MGMSTHILGIKPPDEKWQKMKAAWDACDAAGITPPREVSDFFGGECPDESGVRVELQYPKLHPSVQEWRGNATSGYEVDLRKLPPDVTVLRFFNSW